MGMPPPDLISFNDISIVCMLSILLVLLARKVPIARPPSLPIAFRCRMICFKFGIGSVICCVADDNEVVGEDRYANRFEIPKEPNRHFDMFSVSILSRSIPLFVLQVCC